MNEHDKLKNLLSSNQCENYINNILERDVINSKSHIVDYLTICNNIDEVINLLNIIKYKVSKSNFEKLIHANIHNLHILFVNHLIYNIYKKFDIDACNKLLKEFYHNNNDWYIININGDNLDSHITITHLEHYKRFIKR